MYTELNNFITTFKSDPNFSEEEKMAIIKQMTGPIDWVTTVKAERMAQSATVTDEMKKNIESKITNKGLSKAAKDRLIKSELAKAILENNTKQNTAE